LARGEHADVAADYLATCIEAVSIGWVPHNVSGPEVGPKHAAVPGVMPYCTTCNRITRNRIT